MQKKKVSIQIDPKVHQEAKDLAKSTYSCSLSTMIEALLKDLIQTHKEKKQ